MGTLITFIVLAVISVLAALGMVSSRNAVHSALFLVLNFCAFAVFYLVLNAPFIAMVQVAVYAGAIMVLFLFVIMLLGAEQTEDRQVQTWQRPLAIVLGIGLAAILTFSFITNGADSSVVDVIDTSPTAIGIALFEGYTFPFEVTSVLLLTSMIGVVVLRTAHKRRNRNA